MEFNGVFPWGRTIFSDFPGLEKQPVALRRRGKSMALWPRIVPCFQMGKA